MEQRRGSPQFALPLIVLVICCAFPEGEPSKLRITRLSAHGPELSSPVVVGTRQTTLIIWCRAVTTNSPDTVWGLHWRFPNNSHVPNFYMSSEYDVGMVRYLDNNTWIGLLRMNRVQLSYAGIYKCVANFSGMPKSRSMEIQVSAFNCGELGPPTNGRLRLTSSTTVTYTCDSGYRLRGASTRHCTANGDWTGSVPQCNRVPSQVTGLSLSKAVSSRLPALRATWTTPQSDAPISQYIVQYRKHGTTSWGYQQTISPFLNSNIVPRLAAGTEYTLRVRAVSAVGAGMWSAVQTERTYMKPPNPNHRTVSAVPVNRLGVIRVSWTAPSEPRGELPITGYIIRYKVQNSSVFTYSSGTSNSETEVTGLNPGTIYRVYVAGVSAIGPGSYCCEGTPVLVTTYNGVPSQVTGLSLSKAVSSGLPNLRANWTTPQSDEPISQYIVQYRIHGTTSWSGQHTIFGSPPQNSTIVSRLAAGTEYNVRVRAVSAGGAGNWSAVQTERTYMKPPSPNHDTVSAVPVDRRGVIRVSWTAPTVPRGELPIIGYSIRYKEQNSNSFKHTSVYSTYVAVMIAGLNPGTVYRVYVAGVSEIGPGPFCCEGTPVRVRTYNGAPYPRNVRAVAVDISGVIQVSWSAPTVTSGELPITGYSIRYKVQNSDVVKYKNVTSNSIEAIITGLDLGTVYQVYVAGVNAIGTGLYCCGRTTITVKTYNVPSQVTGVAVSKAIRSGKPALSVTWTTPHSDVIISQYQVEYRRSGTNWRAASPVSPGSTTSTLLEALDAGTVYEVRIRAVSAIGNGTWSEVESEVTYKTSSQPIIGLTNATLQSLSISWSVTSPQDVTYYMVFWWKESEEISKSVALDDTKFFIEGLLSNAAYHVVVLAGGPLGDVNSTSKVFYTTPEQIQGPLSVLVLPKQMLKVSWKPSDDAGRSLIDYIVTTMAGMDYNYSTSVKHPITLVLISGLPQYSSGTVSVWAKNPGALSKPVVLRFRMVNIVTNVIGVSAEWVDAGFTSLRVTVPEGGMYRISYWAVNKSDGPELKVTTTSSSSQVINDFSPDYIYTIVVEDWTGSAERDEQPNVMRTMEGNNVVAVGTFFGGLVAGGVCVVLVEGIVLGLVKLRKQRKGAESTEEEKKTEATYDTVGPKESAALSEHVAMETNPAYASVH